MRDAANKTVFRSCFLVRGVVPVAWCVCAVRAAVPGGARCGWWCCRCPGACVAPCAPCLAVAVVPAAVALSRGCAVRCRAFSPVSCGVSSGFRAARCGLRFAKARCRSVTVPRGNR